MSKKDNVSAFTKIIQAYLSGKLELDIFELRSLHHLVDVELRVFNHFSESERILKKLKLSLKDRINSLEQKTGASSQKRKNLPQLSVKELLEKIAA